jgi:hypothetical protein
MYVFIYLFEFFLAKTIDTVYHHQMYMIHQCIILNVYIYAFIHQGLNPTNHGDRTKVLTTKSFQYLDIKIKIKLYYGQHEII